MFSKAHLAAKLPLRGAPFPGAKCVFSMRCGAISRRRAAPAKARPDSARRGRPRQARGRLACPARANRGAISGRESSLFSELRRHFRASAARRSATDTRPFGCCETASEVELAHDFDVAVDRPRASPRHGVGEDGQRVTEAARLRRYPRGPRMQRAPRGDRPAARGGGGRGSDGRGHAGSPVGTSGRTNIERNPTLRKKLLVFLGAPESRPPDPPGTARTGAAPSTGDPDITGAIAPALLRFRDDHPAMASIPAAAATPRPPPAAAPRVVIGTVVVGPIPRTPPTPAVGMPAAPSIPPDVLDVG